MKEQFWKNGNSGNKKAFLIFEKRAHWIVDKGTYNLTFHIYSGHFWMFQTKVKCHNLSRGNFSPWVRYPDTLFPKISPRHWCYLGSLNKIIFSIYQQILYESRINKPAFSGGPHDLHSDHTIWISLQWKTEEARVWHIKHPAFQCH